MFEWFRETTVIGAEMLFVYFFVFTLTFSFACVAADGVLKHKMVQVKFGWGSMVLSLLWATLGLIRAYNASISPFVGSSLATLVYSLTFVFYFVSAVISAFLAKTSIAGPFCACLREYNATTPYEITDFDETQDDNPIE